MSVQLYQLEYNGHVEYVFAENESEDEIRNLYLDIDHGDTPYELFKDTFTKGELAEVKSISDVPKDHRDWYVNMTDSLYNRDWDCTINQFFEGRGVFHN